MLWELHYNYSLVHSDLEWEYVLGFYLMSQIDMFENYED